MMLESFSGTRGLHQLLDDSPLFPDDSLFLVDRMSKLFDNLFDANIPELGESFSPSDDAYLLDGPTQLSLDNNSFVKSLGITSTLVPINTMSELYLLVKLAFTFLAESDSLRSVMMGSAIHDVSSRLVHNRDMSRVVVISTVDQGNRFAVNSDHSLVSVMRHNFGFRAVHFMDHMNLGFVSNSNHLDRMTHSFSVNDDVRSFMHNPDGLVNVHLGFMMHSHNFLGMVDRLIVDNYMGFYMHNLNSPLNVHLRLVMSSNVFFVMMYPLFVDDHFRFFMYLGHFSSLWLFLDHNKFLVGMSQVFCGLCCFMLNLLSMSLGYFRVILSGSFDLVDDFFGVMSFGGGSFVVCFGVRFLVGYLFSFIGRCMIGWFVGGSCRVIIGGGGLIMGVLRVRVPGLLSQQSMHSS